MNHFSRPQAPTSAAFNHYLYVGNTDLEGIEKFNLTNTVADE
jgi:hypothetical protein